MYTCVCAYVFLYEQVSYISFHNFTLIIMIVHGSTWVFFLLKIWICMFVKSCKFGDTKADPLYPYFVWAWLCNLRLLFPIFLDFRKRLIRPDLSQSFFFLLFLPSSLCWTPVPCGLPLSSYPFFSLTHRRVIHMVTFHMDKYKQVPASQISRSGYTQRTWDIPWIISPWIKSSRMPLRGIWLEL